MSEEIAFTAPVQAVTDPGATRFRITVMVLDWEHARIAITLREWDGGAFTSGKRIQAEYTDATATTIMTALNKANLSVQSLHQRVLTRLIADGKIPSGTLAGAVD